MADPSPANPTTPPRAPPAASSQPSAPIKPHLAWARFRQDMDTMPVDQARKLRPQDIGVQFGPIMDEKQFEEYQKARKGKVHVIR